MQNEAQFWQPVSTRLLVFRLYIAILYLTNLSNNMAKPAKPSGTEAPRQQLCAVDKEYGYPRGLTAQQKLCRHLVWSCIGSRL